jgi:hypothetical protein
LVSAFALLCLFGLFVAVDIRTSDRDAMLTAAIGSRLILRG